MEKKVIVMNKELLPIGSLIELSDGRRLTIISYAENNEYKFCYLCGGYPSYYLMDFIPFSKVKEFKQKYKFYNTDTYLDFDSDYKIIYEGYKNNNFNEFKKQFNNFN